MCTLYPTFSDNLEKQDVTEEFGNLVQLFLLSDSFPNDTWSLGLKISTRFKMLLSEFLWRSRVLPSVFLDICLVPGTEGTGKTSTCLFEVAMWVTCCLFYLGGCSFDKTTLQLTSCHTNSTCLVGLFESQTYFGEA